MLVHDLLLPPFIFFTEHSAGVWGHLKLINPHSSLSF